MDSKKKEKLLFYKKNFPIKQREIFELFEKTLNEPRKIPIHTLELSHKIESGNASSCRLVFFSKPSTENVRIILKFLKLVRKKFNLNISKSIRMLFKINFKDINNIGCGVDLRDNLSDSRIKLYFGVKSKDKYYLNLLEKNFPEKKIKDFLSFSNFFAIGIDFRLSGITSQKLYFFYKQENKNLKSFITENFNEETAKYLQKTKEFAINLSQKRKIIHIFSANPPEIISDNEAYKRVAKVYKDSGYELLIYGFVEGDFKNFNLYF